MIQIKKTQSPAILKFEFPDFITQRKNYEFKNIDETKESPLATQLFYLPFVKTVYISGNFVAIEKSSIVEWEDVQEEVRNKISDFISKGGKVVNEEAQTKTRKVPVTIYSESTPNPSVMKFVSNKLMTKTAVEFKNIDETTPSPLAKELFKFPYVKEVFVDKNYVSITKYNQFEWEDLVLETRTFIKEFIENGGIAVDEALIVETEEHQITQDEYFAKLDDMSQRIVSILEDHVKPAVQSDGGNITFKSYDEETKKVVVVLKGACSGCPSSTFTLKNGIENMLKEMLNLPSLTVEAHNG